ncbi:dTDP-glucose 4,6-dehydratase [Endozoicomonas sp. SM1973]|uniref:dTDP-glucose 4,6-dehydratase n=1 Tax=Spartinivicinus marinus TaxID=2994442 RepID=A0A853I4U0_9GAMM|nr:dTDP-glucose 4,6-dehydratase [Spartinivicinus marinus]MCX4026099.1 dTDP-glucose 4,6-dehydratase [Spartinivicinus marinus]NYZ66582.1 dTDP-glucose 4,6-dehydratase [Spartinivicinus marinus]
MKVLVTGGAGFIGSALVRHILKNTEHTVINIDKLTYAGNLANLGSFLQLSQHFFYQEDICNKNKLVDIFEKHKPDAVVHLAAESHVDRSIDSPNSFIQTNIIGTYNLLETVRYYLSKYPQLDFRFLHVSTDEVFGSLGSKGLFSEKSNYQPSSPYSASKASSDHLVRAWHKTYNLPAITTNCSNNYGPYQYPEKLIPLAVLNCLQGKPIPVYGDGLQIRDWLYVEDHVSGLMTVLEQGTIGETYNIGGFNEKTNVEVVTNICELLDSIISTKPNNLSSFKELISFVTDRPGHDTRYAIDANKISKQLKWSPKESFSSGLTKTIQWYLDNIEWAKRVKPSSLNNNIGLVKK